jgi:integrase
MPKMHMTDLAVQRLSTPGTYFDASTPAFGLRVGKNRKAWFVIRGKERLRTTVGRYPDMSLADARKKGKALLLLTPERNDGVRFEQAYEEYKEAIADLKPRTRLDYKRILDKYYLPRFKTSKLRELAYEHISVVAKGLSPSEKRHYFAVGRTFFKWCVKPPRRYIPHSPLEGVEIKPGGKRKRTLSPTELPIVWTAANEQGYPHGSVVQLILLTGQRRGEIANLRWPWINEKDKTITLPEWITKNSKEHTFPYDGEVQKILDTIPRRNSTDLLFPSRDSDERPVSGWSKFKKELNELIKGVPNFTLHDLRRTMRTIHASIGTPANIGERLINHAAAVQTDVEAVYDLYRYLPEMRQAVDRYEAHLSQLLKLG